MKYCLLMAVLLMPVSLWSQCNNTAYGGGFTCVQSPIVTQNGTAGFATTVISTFAANTTPGNGVLIYGYFCTSNPCANNGAPPTNVTITDDAVPPDTGFQPCANNGSIAYVRYFYCWWLPSVGSAKVFTMHVNGYSSGLWVAEIAGGCNTTACIGTDVPVVYCMGPCGSQIVTTFTNVLVTAFGYSAGIVLTHATGWNNISTPVNAGAGIGNFQAVPGPFTPGFTNAVMLQTLSCSIKSRTNSATTQITVPAMPVY